MKNETYRAGTFSVAEAIMKPMMAVNSPAVICQVRSWKRPELQPNKMPAAPAKINGGQVKIRVTVRLKPSVFTTLGIISA